MTAGIASFVVAVLALAVLSAVPVLIWKKNASGRYLWTTVYVLILVWLFRFWVGVYSINAANGVSKIEELFNSLIHALQTFSMDEDYTEYTLAGKELLESWDQPLLSAVYGIVISILNVVAPVLGGALLLDILAGIFPGIRLHFRIRKHKFVFSELNEASVALAEDICRGDNYKKIMEGSHFNEGFSGRLRRRKPMLVFSDAYLDRESEASSELFERARSAGAVCVKADLLHISLRHSRSIYYFLIDADPKGNISALSRLLDRDKKGRTLWPEKEFQGETATKVFVFAQEDTDSMMVDRICGNADYASPDSKITVRVIRDYRNAVVNLMYDVPLFLPLLSKPKEKRKELYVAILGSGQLAEEAFKAVFWCGQMIGIQLHINVVSKNAASMKWRMEEKYPELLESCKAGSPLLNTHRVRPSAKNPPYSSAFPSGNIDDGFIDVDDASHFAEYPDGLLDQADYFIVALGSDQKNISVADQLRHYRTKKTWLGGVACHCPVIAPVVFDINLAKAIEILNPKDRGPYLVPFADLEGRFSCKNVFMENFRKQAILSGELYNAVKQPEKKKSELEYVNWANLAKAVHAPYKLFALGMLSGVSLEKDEGRFEIKTYPELSRKQKEELAWMEHRRWNAFLRTEGFTCPTREEYDRYYSIQNQSSEKKDIHKSILLKLHPCLVESGTVRTKLPESKEEYDCLKDEYDLLDYVSMYGYHIQSAALRQPETSDGLKAMDYKQYDYMDKDQSLKDLMGI